MQEQPGGLLIGCCTSFRGRSRMRHSFDLGVSVRKAFWGGGVATALIKRTMEEARGMGAERIELGVRQMCVCFKNSSASVSFPFKFNIIFKKYFFPYGRYVSEIAIL